MILSFSSPVLKLKLKEAKEIHLADHYGMEAVSLMLASLYPSKSIKTEFKGAVLMLWTSLHNLPTLSSFGLEISQ